MYAIIKRESESPRIKDFCYEISFQILQEILSTMVGEHRRCEGLVVSVRLLSRGLLTLRLHS